MNRLRVLALSAPVFVLSGCAWDGTSLALGGVTIVFALLVLLALSEGSGLGAVLALVAAACFGTCWHEHTLEARNATRAVVTTGGRSESGRGLSADSDEAESAQDPSAQAPRTIARLDARRTQIEPLLAGWTVERDSTLHALARLAPQVPRSIASYEHLLRNRAQFAEVIVYLERLAILEHSIEHLRQRMHALRVARLELEHVAWRRSHADALRAVGDDARWMDRVRAQVRVGQQLAEEHLDAATHEDVGSRAEQAFQRMRHEQALEPKTDDGFSQVPDPNDSDVASPE
ncbi:MAG: hypothetical protein Q8Q09_22255 [Deltaproteobacteria bacterium]|nr:hypothetical protein [Deltaproteobacteria bacterium]